MIGGGLVEEFGLFGLLVTVIAHLAYNAWEMRRGAVARLRKRVAAISVIQYRQAEVTPGMDEEQVREDIFENGGPFPGDYVDQGDDENAAD